MVTVLNMAWHLKQKGTFWVSVKLADTIQNSPDLPISLSIYSEPLVSSLSKSLEDRLLHFRVILKFKRSEPFKFSRDNRC